MKIAISCLATIFLMAAPAAHASENSLLVELFMGACYLPGAKYESVKATAATANWALAPEEALPILKPMAEPKEFSAWVVERGDEMIFVAAAITPLDGVDRTSCSVAGNMAFEDFEPVLERLNARLLHDLDEVIARVRIYETVRYGNRYLVTTSAMPVDGGPGVLAVAVQPADAQ